MSSTRQLAAILFSDIVGYTELMNRDSNSAMALVKKSMSLQKEIVENNNGLWLKEIGDGALIQFGSALDAVQCAIEIQRMARADLDARLRIGIHLGDVTIENDDIYGDGVNVASRLETICDPGGIYISDSVKKAIRGESISTTDLGEVKLKNIEDDVRVHAIQGTGLPLPSTGPSPKSNSIKRNMLIGVLIIIMLSSGFLISKKYFDSKVTDEVVQTEYRINDKSIAILPF